ncbi:MAG: bifunctional adenosylcobinamide kinase/adenosylcobinamide-phosphate guanylyltransferase [Spirochaetaceae bacterium]|jgi:adenosylcobinamide kinase/adenosylcobinamide-phosphate guanylyltransferase|nr:bifunctional adenosylcobinamide kinase/adenosylcobinamide-phosphate guanylyltransferase [Spirochaetaceae bacterium]
MITLITGGIKAGKSRRALDLAQKVWSKPISFIATAEMLDEEMRRRIIAHQAERASLGGFAVIEEPLALDSAVAGAGLCAIVDCIPMWINNLMHYQKEADFQRILKGFIENMRDCIVVSNETGLGNIPFDETTRRYNLLLAEANRAIASAADAVELMVAGIPVKIK